MNQGYLAAGLITAALCMSGAALAQMALPGSFEVSETGAAVYTIPIAVPPGTAGLEPKLTLQYNSRSGNGLLGVGWSLGGLPAIVRCPKTIAQDGARGGINYDANDRFCLEGERLVAILGTYGADGTEYRTEREGFSKVVSYGSAGTGPASFKVWTKAGQVLEFGNTADSRIEAQGKSTARLWTVNRVSDTAGNYLTVTYAEDNANGEYRPSRIDYTGNAAASVSPYASVRFIYETRPTTDQTTPYEAGSLIKTTQRLTQVQSYAGENLVREYRLAYEQGTTNRSRATSITVCDSANICLPATTLTWQNGGIWVAEGNAGFTGTLGSVATNFGSPPSNNYLVVGGDFNGDGRSDYLLAKEDKQYVFLSNGDGTFTSQTNTIWRYFTYILGDFTPVFGDFDGDGKSDYLLLSGHQQYLHRSNGDGTFTVTEVNLTNGWNFGDVKSNYLVVGGDFNADGRSDYLLAKEDKQYVFLSNGNGTFSPQLNTIWRYFTYILGDFTPVFGDFDGDGKTDYLLLSGHQQYVHKSNGDGTFTVTEVNLTNGWNFGNVKTQYHVLGGDFDGDGKTDYVLTKDANQYVFLSKGDGTFVHQLNTHPAWGLSYSDFIATSGDFNGDGRTDLMFLYGAEQYVFLANGDLTFTPVRNYVPSGWHFGVVKQNYALAVGDFNGDGKADYLLLKDTSQYRFLASGTAPDLLTTLVTGMAATTAVAHAPLSAASALYTKDTGASACAYPCVDVQGPLYVVSQVQTTNGIGGNYTSTYIYAGAKADQSGRGFLGFRQVIVKDEQTLVEQATEYLQTWPFIGLTSLRTKTRSAVELNRTENTYASDDLGSGRRFVKLTQSVESSKELTGTLLPIVTTSYQYDSYGNATQVQVSTGDGHSKTTVNTYANDIANWFLGRLTRAEVTSVTP